jgi:hypothetical protein
MSNHQPNDEIETEERNGSGEQADPARALVEDMSSTISQIASLSDVDADETLELELRLFDVPRRKYRGVAVEAAWMSPELVEDICEIAEQHIDMRKAKRGRSVTVGSIIVAGDETIADFSIDDEYLKPSQTRAGGK